MPDGTYQPIPKPARPRRRSSAERRAADAQLAIPKGDAIRVTDDAVLIWARTLGCCEWCGRVGPTEASHTHSRGAGGADSHENVTALGTATTCPCHGRHHTGHEPTADQLLATADRRERHGRAYARQLAERCPAVLLFHPRRPPPPPRRAAGGTPRPDRATSPSCSGPSGSPATDGRPCTGSDAP